MLSEHVRFFWNNPASFVLLARSQTQSGAASANRVSSGFRRAKHDRIETGRRSRILPLLSQVLGAANRRRAAESHDNFDKTIYIRSLDDAGRSRRLFRHLSSSRSKLLAFLSAETFPVNAST